MTLIRYITFTGLLLALTGCSQPTRPDIDTRAVEDYIEVAELPDVERVPTHQRDYWTTLNEYYVIYHARKGNYLIRFFQRCFALDNPRMIEPDIRYEAAIRPGFDTLRGCRIREIYALTDAQALELPRLGDSPVPD